MNDTQTENKSASIRILEMNSLLKPAKARAINLRFTLKEEPMTITCPGSEISFEIPAWVYVRLLSLNFPQVIWNWVQNAAWLNDPQHGEFTRERYLDAWEKVTATKEQWANRDRGLTIEVEMLFRAREMNHIALTAEFLKVSRETLLVGILASEAAERFSGVSPAWSDMTMLKACQQ